MNPTSALGISSWAACTKPSPARSTGTTTGCTLSRLAGAVVSGVSTVPSTVRSVARRLGEQQRADPLEVLAEQRVGRVAVADAGERVGDQRMVDERDGDRLISVIGAQSTARRGSSA